MKAKNMSKILFTYKHMKQCLHTLAAKGENFHALFKQIQSKWSEPQRHYHTLEHLNHCLEHLEEKRWGQFLKEKDCSLLCVALWFHDIYYDPQAHDNEEQSALFAKKSLEYMSVEQDVVYRW